jgi:FKBP-type peptidyl-prolyl cis-trans isomerase 2
MMNLQKNDFIEIDFTARLKDTGEVFDSTLKSELQKLSPYAIAKPFVFSLGNDMFLKGVDDFLIGKPFDKLPSEYKIDLSPENAFGVREAKLVQMIPIKVFRQHDIKPIPGHSLNFDGKIAKILTVSGGRVMVDFNGPLASKPVIYEIKILKKVEDVNEKIKAINDFLFKKDLKFEIKEKKLIIEVDKGLKSLIELFRDKYKDLVGLDLEVNEIEPPKDKKELHEHAEDKEHVEDIDNLSRLEEKNSKS